MRCPNDNTEMNFGNAGRNYFQCPMCSLIIYDGLVFDSEPKLPESEKPEAETPESETPEAVQYDIKSVYPETPESEDDPEIANNPITSIYNGEE